MAHTIVMLGGNGYIGRNVIDVWHRQCPRDRFVVVSRSGVGAPAIPEVTNVIANADDYDAVNGELPTSFDMICDFVGGMDPSANMPAAKVMARLAETHQCLCMGYVQGRLGGREFVESKEAVARFLEQQPVPVAIVDPTLVYGNGRNDKLSRMVPLLRFCGIFVKGLRPDPVGQVAEKLVKEMRARASQAH